MSQDFQAPTRPVADKSYRCIYCIDRIAPGTKHFKFVGIYQGDWQNWRMHLECIKAHEDNNYSSAYEDGEICPERHRRGFSCTEMSIAKEIEHGAR